MGKAQESIIRSIVDNDMCIGCGLCTIQCPENALRMHWNQYGFLVPLQIGNCSFECDCIKVCPFNPNPDNSVKTEDELAQEFFKDAPKYNINIGKYKNIYVGYSNNYRVTSSSGGLATYLTAKLLEDKIVNAVFSVKEGKNYHYEYSIIRDYKDVLAASETKYYPVSLADVMSQLDEIEGRVAVVGVACFIKSIRLYQHYNPAMKEKIAFTIGIICGGVKSRFFTEYLAERAGIIYEKCNRPKYRIKDLKSSASDYSFGCYDENANFSSIKMRKVGDMWGTGMFKNNACDFCDDVACELADVSLGDAWVEPYKIDGRGTSIVVSRNELSDTLLKDGVNSKQLVLSNFSEQSFINTQKGSYFHRFDALGYRIRRISKSGVKMPPKRHNNYNISFYYKRVQKQRMKLRKSSLDFWAEAQSAEKYDNLICKQLKVLHRRTKTYHLYRKLRSRFYLIMGKKEN